MSKGTYQNYELIGRLGADPEVDISKKSGTLYARLSLASTKTKKDKDGKIIEKTTWLKATVFNQQAEFARDYLKKGDTVHILAELANKKWTDKEGVDHYTVEIMVNSIQQVGKHSIDESEDISEAEANAESDLSDIE